MKKILISFALLAGIFAAVSCSKNQPPVFDDANAFVAFDKASASIEEAIVSPEGEILPQTKILQLPVTLGSVKGLTETIKFNVTDGTAKAGVNFNLKTTSGTLSFDANNRTQYIEFEILYYDEYTGDLKFTVDLVPSDNVALGYMSTCTVTIADVDHPLTDLLGDYVATTPMGAKGNSWKMTLYKDEKDDHMVWFFNLFGNSGWADFDTMFYGNVDDDLTTIIIPYGQQSEYKYAGETPVTLYWIDADGEGDKTGSNTVKIIKDASGKITGLEFDENYGFYALLEDLGWVGYVFPQVTAEKQ